MTDIVTEARETLSRITEGHWWWTGETRARLIAGGSEASMLDAREIIRCAALLHPGTDDADFIAAAPDLTRRLLAEVDALRVERDAAVVRAEGAEVAWTDTITERDEALAVIERVRDLARRADRAEADLMRDEYQGEPGWVQTPDILRALDGGEQ